MRTRIWDPYELFGGAQLQTERGHFPLKLLGEGISTRSYALLDESGYVTDKVVKYAYPSGYGRAAMDPSWPLKDPPRVDINEWAMQAGIMPREEHIASYISVADRAYPGFDAQGRDMRELASRVDEAGYGFVDAHRQNFGYLKGKLAVVDADVLQDPRYVTTNQNMDFGPRQYMYGNKARWQNVHFGDSAPTRTSIPEPLTQAAFAARNQSSALTRDAVFAEREVSKAAVRHRSAAH